MRLKDIGISLRDEKKVLRNGMIPAGLCRGAGAGFNAV